MSERFWTHKGSMALILSVAVNIFLLAFTLGHFNGRQQAPFDRMMMAGNRPYAHGGPGRGFMPPPGIGPHDLFGPKELQLDETRMREHFEKMDALRKDFASKLQAGPVSKEEVAAHFAAFDEVMNNVRMEARDRAVERISSMSDEDRKNFAQKLMRRHEERFDVPMPSPLESPDNAPSGSPKLP